jgi:Zn-dependent metalloprotease
MRRNRWSSSKTLFTITLALVLICFTTTGLWSAKKVKLTKETKQKFMEKLNQRKKFDGADIAEVFGLTRDEGLKLRSSRVDFNKMTHYRYQQTYKNIPVWGMDTSIGIGAANTVDRLHGSIALDIPKDIKGVPKKLDPEGALKDMKENHKKKNKNAKWFFTNEKADAYIYIDKKNKAYLCYAVSFFVDNENGEPSRPVYLISAKNGKILHSYENLQHADGTGPGGNQKIGQYYYGPSGDYPPFGVTQNGSTCTMNTTDVKTVNLNHGTSGSTAYSYTCFENTHKEINGAYSPLNDAQFFGQVVYDMYQAWYGVPVLPFQLTMRVHYSSNYENAFWNGSSMTFGDGYNTFHPLVCLDVSAHEVAHGFTENHSNLTYSGQSGGINEAYSDMAGESAEYYSRGSNDFMCGYDIFKAAGQALRYLYDPPLDGISIDHVDDYYSGMDVHYSSGVYNKAFYLLASTSGWDTKTAFDVFTKANMDYWTSGTTFSQGAVGVRDAAIDYGYNCGDVAAAFAVVGITVTCPVAPVADFSAAPTSGGAPLTVNFTDLSSNSPTSWSWNFGDSGASTSQNPSHTYTSPGTYTVSLTATNSNGSDTETKTGYITVLQPQAPVADVTANTTNPTVGGSVNFTDTSLNVPTSWNWTFDGGTPGTSTAQNPTVTYNTVGTYNVTLTATNAQGSDSITKTGYITVSAIPYCDSQGNNYSYEWISRVVVGDIDNSSGAAGYTDFTGITGNLTSGNSVSVSLTPGFSSSTYTEYWKIWIDYNGDHDFTDAGEEVFSGTSSSTVTGSFTVPLGLNITTRMRVTMKYSGAPTSCETFTYGEVEDYTVNISGGVVLPPVAEFTASATTVTVGGSVTFTDQSTNDPTSWNWSFEGGTPSSSTAQNPTVTYNTVGTFNVSLTATNSAGSDGETKVDYITVVSEPEDEIAEAVDNASLSFTHSGNADWSLDTAVYYYDGDSAKSGTITHNQTSSIETTVNLASAKAVKFYWKVSSEANYDYLRFYIDGVLQDQIAGNIDWAQKSYNLSSGSHTLKWTYYKDGSVSSLSDCGWVDKVEFTDPAADPIAEAVDYPGLTFSHSGNGNWFSQTGTVYYGGDAAESADISNNQTSTMTTTISGITSVKFFWKVSSESGYDYLRFYIDGVLQEQISGSVDWTQKTYSVSSGSHTLTWTYYKDYSVSNGSDCGWVDKLELQ